jgi:hypothetical protein
MKVRWTLGLVLAIGLPTSAEAQRNSTGTQQQKVRTAIVPSGMPSLEPQLLVTPLGNSVKVESPLLEGFYQESTSHDGKDGGITLSKVRYLIDWGQYEPIEVEIEGKKASVRIVRRQCTSDCVKVTPGVLPTRGGGGVRGNPPPKTTPQFTPLPKPKLPVRKDAGPT